MPTLSGATTREINTQAPAPAIDVEAARKAVVSEVIDFVRNAPQAVPLETLADRAVRIVGREKTVGTNWGGSGRSANGCSPISRTISISAIRRLIRFSMAIGTSRHPA